ncbi:jasmonic acid-amido synthetase [Acrasis kona]|uniref:Jasmonic acid-amido synthetase n=1 Tax=Acrasis kona TaxID=1008807 RepID=A0AAW2YKA2_9EUKA
MACRSYYNFNQKCKDRCSVSHTLSTKVSQWAAEQVIDSIGEKALEKFNKEAESFDKIQELVFLQWVDENKDTIYGKDHSFESIKTLEEFRKLPLTEYSDYDKYIELIKQGTGNVLTSPVLQLGQTSGTSTGRKNLIPVTSKLKFTFLSSIPPALSTLYKDLPLSKSFQKSCKIMFEPTWEYTDSGTKVGCNSSVPSDMSDSVLDTSYSSPSWLLKSKTDNPNDLLYLHGLFAIRDRNLGSIESNFISVIHNFCDVIEKNWKEYAEMIESGVVPPLVDSVLEKGRFNQFLERDPERAQEIRNVMSQYKPGEQSLLKVLFPNLNVVIATDTGDFEFYGKQFKEKFISRDDVPIYSPFYAATEGLMGVNYNVFEKKYVLLPRAMFFEFLPVSQSDSTNHKTLLANQLESGAEYELVITNWSGLYRYRLGDVVKFHGYKGQAPIIQVMYRRGMFLNKVGERTNEKSFQLALENASKAWNTKVLDYTVSDIDSSDQYVVYVEVEDPQVKLDKNKLESELCSMNPIYADVVRTGRMKRADIKVVRPGTFLKMRDLMISLGAHPAQLKIPRVLRRRELQDLLNSNIVTNNDK